MMDTTDDEEVLNVFLIGDRSNARQCLVFDPNTVYTLHTKRRIVTKLIGSLPHHSSQNLFHSVPALLSPDQVTICLKRGWISIRVEQQQTVDADDDLQEDRAVDESSRKRVKVADCAYNGDSTESEKSPVVPFEELKEYTHYSSLRDAMYNLPNQRSDKFAKTVLEDVSALWQYPQSRKEVNRYKVFEALYDKGYYVTSGDRFGCDFLVYKQDPLIYHSEWMVYVVDEKETWKSFPMISIGRLGNNVHKTVLYASVVTDPVTQQEQVKFLSWSWFDIETLKLYRANKKKQSHQPNDRSQSNPKPLLPKRK